MTPSHLGDVKIRKSEERGYADHGWLKSRHTFSFANYYDPVHSGFRSLRVINQDRVAPGGGFPTHPHRDMEIFSFVLEGVLEHADSLGNRRKLCPGEIQLMSAGSGVTHSEYNPSSSEVLHFLQIWIQPYQKGLVPSYTEWRPEPDRKNDSKILIISESGREGSARIHQDAEIYQLRLDPGEDVSHRLGSGRGLWLQVIEGTVWFQGEELDSGDAANSEEAGDYGIRADAAPVLALLFDLGESPSR